MGPFVTGQPMAPCNGIQHSHTVDSGFQVLEVWEFAGLQIPDSLTWGETSTQTSPSKLGDGLVFTQNAFLYKG